MGANSIVSCPSETQHACYDQGASETCIESIQLQQLSYSDLAFNKWNYSLYLHRI